MALSQRLLIAFFVSVLILSGCNGTPTSLVPITQTPTKPPQPTTLETANTPQAVTPTATATPTLTIQPTQEPEATATSAVTAAPTETLPPTQANLATATSTAFPNASDCTNLAAFYGDVTIPDGVQMDQGEQFTKTWRVRNNGTCTWGGGYLLVFASGELIGGPMSQALPFAAPGDIIEISVELTAPSVGGSFTGYWQFQDPQGDPFATGITGNIPLWVVISVPFYSTPLPSAEPEEETQPGAPTSTPDASGGQPTGCKAARDSAVEAQVLSLINQARSANGLEPLTLNNELSAAALMHSMDMACNDFVSHTGSDGSTWYTRATAAGYSYPASVRENIYVGNPAFGGTAQGAYNWWMNSQIHRDNILFENVTEIGIAYVFNPDSEYGGYYTTVFGKSSGE